VPNLYIVFFAPSSSSLSLPYLKREFELPLIRSDPTISTDENPERVKPRAIPIAIGPTTATYLQEEGGIQLDIICKKPEPSALVSAIENFRLNR
jgi:uroporphyrinogen-III synthase